MTWPKVRLGDICNVLRGTTITQTQTAPGTVPVVAGGLQPSYFHKTSNRPANVISVSASGANAGFVNFWSQPIFASDCSTVAPKSPSTDARYVYHALVNLQSYIYKKLRSGAAQPHVYARDLADLAIPHPPLIEQRRIAAILDQAETLRTQRRTALALLDSLTQSLFLDMFGDPVVNPKGWPTESLTDLCHCYSGSTPSKAKKEYWEGELPWFSAKDMKAEDLFDSEDHISEHVPETTTLKLLPKDTVAIVVRGMILAHTFPVCVLRIPATINQDLKALLPKQPVNSQFLAACLRSQSGFVLEKVSEAGHGTKRLDAHGLQSLRIPRPGDALEQTFATRIAAIEALKATHRRALAALDALFASLQQRAFAGGVAGCRT